MHVVGNGVQPPSLEQIEFAFATLAALLSSGFREKPHSIATMNGVGNGVSTRPVEPPREEGPPVGAPRAKRKRKLPKTIPREEVEAILEACNLRSPTGMRDRCMMEIMFRAGLRIGETRRLRVRDVDLEAGEIRVYESKGGDGTAYFDTRRVAPLLERWLDMRRRELRRRLGKVPRDAPLFCTIRKPAGEEIGERSVAQMIKRRARNAGVDPSKVTAHRFRHTFATELLSESGVTVYDVKEALRHASLKSTEVYLHVSNPQLREKIQRRRT